MSKDGGVRRCKTAAGGPVAVVEWQAKGEEYGKSGCREMQRPILRPDWPSYLLEANSLLRLCGLWKARLRAVTRGLNTLPHGHSSCGWVSGMPNTARTLYHRQSAVARSCAHKLTFVYLLWTAVSLHFLQLSSSPSQRAAM